MRAYLAGPMRGYELWNHPAFEEATKTLRAAGWEIVSPHEIDLALGLDPTQPFPLSLEEALHHDLHEITHPKTEAIIMLTGWTESEGGIKEVKTAMSCGHDVYLYDSATGHPHPMGYAEVNFYIDRSRLTDGSEYRVTSSTGGQKGQKLARFDLVPPDAEFALAEHFGKGAQKYADRNWEKGTDWSLNYAAARRHLNTWWNGEDLDPETGSSHLICVAWHMFVLYHFCNTHPEMDDRPA